MTGFWLILMALLKDPGLLRPWLIDQAVSLYTFKCKTFDKTYYKYFIDNKNVQ